MLSLRELHVALAVLMMPGCTLIPLCEVPGHEHKCAVDDGMTEMNGGDTESDSSGPETSTETMTTDVPETDTETETGSCEGAGCPCTAVENCSPGLECVDGECIEVVCGDTMTHGDEQCDDGNEIEGDGCDNDCTYTQILSMDAGGYHTCVLIEGGRVRCWGLNFTGQLGLGNTEFIGDDELPNTVDDVELPMPALQVSGGLGEHTCALLEDGSVYCWGLNIYGQLGYGNTNTIGDDEALIGPVSVGANAEEITVGGGHTCVRTSIGGIRCWGRGLLGRLGYGNEITVGDNEVPSVVGDVPVGGPVAQVAAGASHTCAISLIGTVYCWGRNDLGLLGYGNTNYVGDNETPASVGAASIIPMGLGPFTKATQISGGVVHTCALFETGDVLCWGDGFFGQLGRGDVQIVGDNELPSIFPPLEFPDDVIQISSGSAHNCLLLANNDAYCWGASTFGQLGYGNLDNIGDDEPAAAGGPIDLGAPIVQIDAGFFFTCALTQTNEVRCWGSNDMGQLGLGHTNKVGDDEFPLDEPPISIF